ncbi:hypothetical protein [Crateriforma spongiae]|uniref:hypothetical protein n=1 Tax=Crateriforma spongiae TaxID=2724528 RepID=UPI0039AF26DB
MAAGEISVSRRFLGQIEIAQAPRQSGEDATRILSEDFFDRDFDFGHGTNGGKEGRHTAEDKRNPRVSKRRGNDRLVTAAHLEIKNHYDSSPIDRMKRVN